MKEVAGTLLEWRKIGSSLAGVVCVLCGLIVFAPTDLIERTGLLKIRDQYLPWIGLTFLVSLSIFLAGAIEGLLKMMKNGLTETRISRNLRTVLIELTIAEKEFLRPYILENRNSIYSELQSGVVGSLSAKNVIYRGANISNYAAEFPFNLQPWARKALTAEPSLLT